MKKTQTQNSGGITWRRSASYSTSSPGHSVMDYGTSTCMLSGICFHVSSDNDHINYARRGTVYLDEMAKLPPDILREFQQGTCVVMHANRRFNQVFPPDHITEWLNATGKKSGGLVGITKVASSLSRWTLSYNLRTLISSHTKQMFHVTMNGDDEVYTHTECTKGRRIKDDGDEARMATYLKQHGVFHNKVDTLQNMINNDLVTVSIEELLLGVECLGKYKNREKYLSGSR